MNEIILNGINVSYLFKISRLSKRVKIAVHPEGRVVISVPRGVSENEAQKFLLQKSSWVVEKVQLMKDRESNPIRRTNKREYKKHKEEALNYIRKRVDILNQDYGFRYKAISVRNQKTRWGSCSTRGNLSFNYKILFLPESLGDYIIVHELCHLKEFNHSTKFWNLVEKTIPNGRKISGEIRKNLL